MTSNVPFEKNKMVSTLATSVITTYSGVAYVIPWPRFVNQECYIPKCLSRRAVFENSSCEFFPSLFKVKAKGQRSMLKNSGDTFIIHDLW